FSIPHSNAGYGFTLRASPDGNRALLVSSTHPTSTPNSSSCQSLVASKSVTYTAFPAISIQHVQPNSPAAKVGLPVGHYLVEIDCEPLSLALTLKQVVSRIREASTRQPDGMLRIGVAAPQTIQIASDVLHVSAQTGLARTSEDLSTSFILDDSNCVLPQSESCRTRGTDLVNGGRTTDTNFSHSNSCARSPCLVNFNLVSPSSREHSVGGMKAFCLNPPRPSTPYGRALVCEERCIDVDYVDENNPHGFSARSLRIQRPLFKLAHPVLNLKWIDVGPNEALRQWCIADLLKDVDRISDELLTGIQAYRTGLKQTAKLENDELRLLLGNITEVACHAWRLSRRLREACLPYTTTTETCGLGTLRRRDTEPKPRSNTEAVSKKSSGLLDANGTDRRPTFLARIRNSLIGGRQRSVSESKNSLRKHAAENSNVQMVASNRSGDVLFKPNPQSDPRNDTPDSTIENLRILTPPPHGHLDCPGSLILESLDSLLADYSSYTSDYLDRLRFMQELRRRHPELRSFLRNQSVSSGVPTMTNFLTLPQQLMRQLLVGLQRVVQHTALLHTDRCALDECVSKLHDAVMCPLKKQTVQVDQVKPANWGFATFESPKQSIRDNAPRKSDTKNVSPVSSISAVPSQLSVQFNDRYEFSSRASVVNSAVCDLGRSDEVFRLFCLLEPSACPDSVGSIDLTSPQIQDCPSDRCIIFRGSLLCTLEQLHDRGDYQQVYIGQVYSYLLAHYLVVVRCDKDILVTNTLASTVCSPIPLTDIYNQLYNTDTQFTLETNSNLRLSFVCPSVEDMIVWKTLLQQRLQPPHT
ncbi:uncharacterized protein DEA37_0009232, partial [Paragonimus westermani]